MSDTLFAIARSGMDVERLRMEVIAQNLANAGSARGAGVEGYQPVRLVSGPNAASGFEQALGDAAQKKNKNTKEDAPNTEIKI